MNGKVLAGLVVLLLAFNGVLLYQNVQLKQRSGAIERAPRPAMPGADEVQSTLQAAGLVGSCGPRTEGAETVDAETTGAETTNAEIGSEPPTTTAERPLGVDLYFSLTADCMSCVEAEVGKWGELAAASEDAGDDGSAPPFRVRGFTQVDGPAARVALERDLQPAFPVHRLDDLRATLTAAGISTTPAVVVSDGATGRVLLTHFPAAFPKEDRTFLERVRSLGEPCP